MPINNPVIPGFNPDPSVVLVDGVYYLVTSTFEWFPGLPVYRSTDLQDWELIGHVADRPEQLQLTGLPSEGGVFAPTIRFHDGVYYVITTVAGSRWNVVFTATDPAGPWSDGVELPDVRGIDPDLAWDDDGAAYVTYAGAEVGPEGVFMQGITQCRVDLSTGQSLEAPRSLWSGTGLKFPEGPHVRRIGEWWYLLIAEGGTERGHTVSIARGSAPTGPFEGCPSGPLLTHAGSDSAIQNTGHADLVQTPDGGWALVLLGARTGGLSQRFTAIGRETFVTSVDWVDGWPVVTPVEAGDGPQPLTERITFEAPLDGHWIATRGPWARFARVAHGRLRLAGPETAAGGLDALDAAFVGRRQRHHTVDLAARVDASSGRGGLALRSDDEHHISLTAGADGRVVARARLRTLEQSWELDLGSPVADLRIGIRPVPAGMTPEARGLDLITLAAAAPGGEERVLAELDGRYWAMEVAAHMTGRVVGLLAESGQLDVDSFTYDGR